MAEKEYILFCDESDRDGKFYSNFFGGLLVGASQYEPVTRRLNEVKTAQNLHAEVKWAKVTEAYLGKYLALVNAFFEEMEAGRLKVRIMFSQNARKPKGLTSRQVALSYWLLYYQFVKHGFGFESCPPSDDGTYLRLYFDQFPDTGEQATQFKGYVYSLQDSAAFRRARLLIRRDAIAEVRSHDHVLLQCLDVVLGAMTFRLNDKHKAKLEGSSRRGSRTIAKEKLYKAIHGRICRLKKNFNIGITTGGGVEGRWQHPYAHWLFVPADHEYDQGLTKGGQKKNPT